MKTSNKMLTGGFLTMFLLLIVGIIIAKNNMVFHETNFNDESGNPQTAQLTEKLQSQTLNLHGGDFNYYTLDPNLEGISISADDKVIKQIRVADEGTLVFYREGDFEFKPQSPVVITIGIKGKEDLTISLKNGAKLNTIGMLMANLKIVAEDHSYIELQYKGKHLQVEASDNSQINLEGMTYNLELLGKDNVIIKATDFLMDTLELDLKNKAILHANSSKVIGGNVRNEALASFQSQWKEGQIKEENNGKVILEK